MAVRAPQRAWRQWRLPGFAGELRYALRGLYRYPGFSLTVITTLAVGIGINAAVFAIASAFLLRGFPLVEDNDRIAYISTKGSACCVSYPDFLDLREQASLFTGMEVVHGFPAAFADGRGFPEVFDVTEVSTGTFGLIGQTPLLGRDFTAADGEPGAVPVAILSYGFWERRYARDPAVLGAAVRLNGTPVTIVGVMPAGFSFPQRQELWLPIVATGPVLERERRNLWFAFGRLREGVTLEAARAEVETISRRLAAAYPQTNHHDDQLEALTFNEFFIGRSENSIYGSMWGAVGFVLLIACANLANLMLAHSIGRSREISVRVALGASRSRIVRQLLAESGLLSVAGGLLGWWLAKWAVRAYAASAHGPGWSPWRVLDYSMDYRILAYLTVISVVTGLLFGLAPAGELARLDVNAVLKRGGRGATAGGPAGRLSNLLMVAQVTLAVVLLAGAGVITRSFLNIAETDPGVVTDGVSAAFLSLPEADYATEESRIAFFGALERRLEASAGIDGVAFADILPTWGSVRLTYELRERPLNEESRPNVSALVTSPGYFRALGAKLLAGRAFDTTDRDDSAPVVIVNRRFAERNWPGEEAIGKQLRVFGRADATWLTVVGVVSNIVQDDVTRQSFDPVLYLLHGQHPREGMWALIHARLSLEAVAAELRQAVRELDPDLPVRFGPYRLVDRLAEVYADPGLYVTLFFMFAAIALFLAAVGLYAVVAHAVSQYTKEIGIRVAMGARPHDILRLVLKIGLLPIGIGLGLGLVLSLGFTRILQSQLVGVSPADPTAYVIACAALGLAAAFGCLIPVRRALGVDPAIALRHD